MALAWFADAFFISILHDLNLLSPLQSREKKIHSSPVSTLSKKKKNKPKVD